jgi:hypothetical protein
VTLTLFCAQCKKQLVFPSDETVDLAALKMRQTCPSGHAFLLASGQQGRAGTFLWYDRGGGDLISLDTIVSIPR